MVGSVILYINPPPAVGGVGGVGGKRGGVGGVFPLTPVFASTENHSTAPPNHATNQTTPRVIPVSTPPFECWG